MVQIPGSRQHLQRAATVILLVAAAVTALALYRARTRGMPLASAGPPPPADRADLLPLPPYTINVAFGPVDISADASAEGNGAPLIVTPGEPIEIVVRPERAITEKVTVRLYWNKQDRLRRWRPPSELGPYSTYRYRAPGERPFGRGQGHIVAVVSPVADVPDELPASWLQRPPAHWQVLRQNIRWK